MSFKLDLKKMPSSEDFEKTAGWEEDTFGHYSSDGRRKCFMRDVRDNKPDITRYNVIARDTSWDNDERFEFSAMFTLQGGSIVDIVLWPCDTKKFKTLKDILAFFETTYNQMGCKPLG